MPCLLSKKFVERIPDIVISGPNAISISFTDNMIASTDVPCRYGITTLMIDGKIGYREVSYCLRTNDSFSVLMLLNDGWMFGQYAVREFCYRDVLRDFISKHKNNTMRVY